MTILQVHLTMRWCPRCAAQCKGLEKRGQGGENTTEPTCQFSALGTTQWHQNTHTPQKKKHDICRKTSFLNHLIETKVVKVSGVLCPSNKTPLHYRVSLRIGSTSNHSFGSTGWFTHLSSWLLSITILQTPRKHVGEREKRITWHTKIQWIKCGYRQFKRL